MSRYTAPVHAIKLHCWSSLGGLECMLWRHTWVTQVSPLHVKLAREQACAGQGRRKVQQRSVRHSSFAWQSSCDYIAAEGLKS
jgi:hypothetical protein